MKERPDEIVSFITDRFQRDNADVSDAAHETMEAASKVFLQIINRLIEHDSDNMNGISASRILIASVRAGWSRTCDVIEEEINRIEAEK
jgi:predicted YcjX-like family ATPase